MSRNAAFLFLAATSLTLAACAQKAMEPEELADFGYDYEASGEDEGAAAIIPEAQDPAPSPDVATAPQLAQPVYETVTAAPTEMMEREEASPDDFAEADMGSVASITASSGRDRTRAKPKASAGASRVTTLAAGRSSKKGRKR